MTNEQMQAALDDAFLAYFKNSFGNLVEGLIADEKGIPPTSWPKASERFEQRMEYARKAYAIASQVSVEKGVFYESP